MRVTLEALHWIGLAYIFTTEAKAVLDNLVTQEQQMKLLEGREGETREAVAYEYMVPWGYRIVVHQQPLHVTSKTT